VKLWLWVKIVCCVLAIVACSTDVSAVAEIPARPWVTVGQPNLSKLTDLPIDTEPSIDTTDCVTVKVPRRFSLGDQEDCMTVTSFGMAGPSGIVFDGSAQEVSVEPPPPFFGLFPIPGRSACLSVGPRTSASTTVTWCGWITLCPDVESGYHIT
jgi:hypothetical protein